METADALGMAHVSSAPAPLAPGGIRTYEEIEGGEGRVLSFRPRRYAAADLAPLRPSVTVRAGEAPHACPLLDVSRSGVAFLGVGLTPPAPGQALDLEVRLDAHAVWSGRAEVRGVRGPEGARVIAASFGRALLEEDELRLLHDVWVPAVAGPRLAEEPWAGAAGDYRAGVADLALHLAELQQRLDRLERALPWRVDPGPASVAHAALVARVRADVAADVLAAITAIGAARRAVEPAEAAAADAFAARQLQALVLEAPWMRRAKEKPLGYAGDFEVMNYLYERDFEGPTLFARTLGHAFMQAAAARAVRARKDLVKGALRSVLASEVGRGQPVRLLSIAAGPARELQELFGELDELPAGEVEIVLFDQDKRALEHAFQRLRPLVDARFPGRVRIEFLNESVRRLLRDLHLFEGVPRFHAVYAAGLFDYFREPTAVRLARNLFAAAAPGGRVLIGNMVEHVHRWVMDVLLDWTLLYRTRDELLAIGRRAAPHAQVRLLEEATGVNPFIELIAPA